MLNTLGLMHKGRLVLHDATEPFNTDHPRPFERRMIDSMFSDPNALFIGHTESRTVFPDVAARLNQAAMAAGVRKQVLRTISDSNAHPVFEIFRFERRLIDRVVIKPLNTEARYERERSVPTSAIKIAAGLTVR